MRKKRWYRSALIAALLLAPQWATAQSNPQFIAFPGTSKAALYKPDTGPAPRVGILVMHRTSNYLRHRACTELLVCVAGSCSVSSTAARIRSNPDEGL